MAQPPAGFVKDPNSPDWWLDPAGDPQANATWWQQPPSGFEYDERNPGWAFRGGDPQDALNWWRTSSIVDPPGLVKGIDVASYQPTDLSGLIAKAGAGHVVVRMYQSTSEGARLQEHSRQQVASVLANGCSVGGYCWLYAAGDPARQVQESLDLAASIGIVLPVLWLDIEKYTDGSCPNADQVMAALNYGRSLGQRMGVYTGLYIWRAQLGGVDFSGELLWAAAYNGIPDLSTPSYGGMTVVGHQYNDVAGDGSSLDVDVFDPSVT